MVIIVALAVLNFFVLGGLILIMIHAVSPRSGLMRPTPGTAEPPPLTPVLICSTPEAVVTTPPPGGEAE